MSAVIDTAPASAAPTADTRDARAAWALTAPALMLFVGVLVIPLAMTVMLSFHDWGQYKGIEPVFILKNWHEVATDPYFAEMFWRTFRIAVLTTLITAVLGAPEAYILNRMSGRWKSFFLLVILGPLLISVVARTLGWALLFGGNNGLVNKLLMSLGLIGSPLPFMFTETGMVVALAHAMMPFMVLSVWGARHGVAPQLGNARPVRSARAPSRSSAASCCRRSCRVCCRARSSCSRCPPARLRRPPSSVAAGSRSRRRSPMTSFSTRSTGRSAQP